jgi:hypothetical protein
MNTTQTTAAILSKLTTAEGRQLATWCRKQAAELAKLDKAAQQAAIRGWVAQRLARR